MNLVILEGRLGRDPELRHTAGGKPVCNFSLATSQKFTDKGGKKRENVQWHRITCWGNLAERVGQYLKKGRRILISNGRLEYSEYKDKESGETKYSTTIVATAITFLDSKGTAAAAGAGAGALELPDETIEGDEGEEQEVGQGGDGDSETPF